MKSDLVYEYNFLKTKVYGSVYENCAPNCRNCHTLTMSVEFPVSHFQHNMQLFVRALETHTFDVCGTETVGDVKLAVAEAEGLHMDDLALYHAGKPLSDEASLAECGELSTLDVELRLLGGMF